VEFCDKTLVYVEVEIKNKSKLKTNHGTDRLCLGSFTYTVTESIYWQKHSLRSDQ